jgi:hypothetical protein
MPNRCLGFPAEFPRFRLDGGLLIDVQKRAARFAHYSSVAIRWHLGICDDAKGTATWLAGGRPPTAKFTVIQSRSGQRGRRLHLQLTHLQLARANESRLLSPIALPFLQHQRCVILQPRVKPWELKINNAFKPQGPIGAASASNLRCQENNVGINTKLLTLDAARHRTGVLL